MALDQLALGHDRIGFDQLVVIIPAKEGEGRLERAGADSRHHVELRRADVGSDALVRPSLDEPRAERAPLAAAGEDQEIGRRRFLAGRPGAHGLGDRADQRRKGVGRPHRARLGRRRRHRDPELGESRAVEGKGAIGSAGGGQQGKEQRDEST